MAVRLYGERARRFHMAFMRRARQTNLNQQCNSQVAWGIHQFMHIYPPALNQSRWPTTRGRLAEIVWSHADTFPLGLVAHF
jgi:hypothetical protein